MPLFKFASNLHLFLSTTNIVLDNLENLSPEELESRCRLAWGKFYRNLSPLVDRTQPADFARAMCQHLKDVEMKHQRLDLAPHFAVALAIEFNCAWTRSYYNEQVTLAGYEKIIRKIIEFNDPNDFHLLDNDFSLFTLKFFRRQLPFQHPPTINVFYRIGQCLLHSAVLEPVRAWFEREKGVSSKDWFLAGCVYAATGFRPEAFKSKDALGMAAALNIPMAAMHRVAEEASITPKRIKKEWDESRRNTPYREHFNIPSVFHNHPIIDFGGNHYFVPFPKLLFAFLEQRLQKIYKEHPQGGLKIGSAMEQYVLSFLQSSKVATSIWTQAEIKERVTSGYSCDIVATLADCTVLIEVKATRFSREKLSSRTIQKDTSTSTIAKAYKQLIETARSLSLLDGIGNTQIASMPIIGIVVTAWNIPSANAPAYHDQYIREADTTLWRSSDPPTPPFSFHPTTMEVGAFELLCEHLANGKSLLAFHEQRAEKGYGQAGEWRDYLAHISNEDGHPPRLEDVQKEWDAFFPVRISRK